MTEAPRRRRWPKQRVRALAWMTGAATFITGVVGIAGAPKPSTAAPLPRSQRAAAPRIIERHVIRRVIVIDAPKAAPITASPPVIYVPAAAPAPAPAPAPPAQTSGS
jgi:hypothetical protein